MTSHQNGTSYLEALKSSFASRLTPSKIILCLHFWATKQYRQTMVIEEMNHAFKSCLERVKCLCKWFSQESTNAMYLHTCLMSLVLFL